MLVALGAGMFTFNSCSEEPTTDPTPTPTEKKCYIIEQKDVFPETATITYMYNDKNQVLSATKGTAVTNFEYTDNKLTKATTGSEVSTFVYVDGGAVLQRINQTTDGIDNGYIYLTRTNNKLTKVETHNTTTAEDVIETITLITYDGQGNISSLVTQEYNASTKEFETQFSLTSVETDGKLNPFSTDLAYFFMNTQNPKAFGDHNITSGSAMAQGFPAEYKATMVYNENGYPTAINAAVKLAVGDVPAPTTLTYTCK